MNGGGAICIGTVRPLVTSVIHQILHGIVCYSCPTIPNSHTILPDNSWGTNTLNILSLQRGIPSALAVRFIAQKIEYTQNKNHIPSGILPPGI